ENDWGYHQLPRLTGAHGTYQTTMRMLEGGVDGYFLFGQNPAVGSANGRLQRLAMSKLKRMVVRDFYMIESATFWRDGPEVESGELTPEQIATEMFYLPAANHTEKAGSFTQTQRMVQWRDQAVQPPGDARSDLEFMYELGLRVRVKLRDSTDPRDPTILERLREYPPGAHGEPGAGAVHGRPCAARCAQLPSVHLRARPARPGEAAGLHGPARPADPRTHLGLPADRARRTRRRGGARRDQRPPPRGRARRPAAVLLLRDAGRRLDRRRVLDLRRRRVGRL